MRLYRSRVLHTPENPFETFAALVAHEDGAVAVAPDGTIGAVGEFAEVCAAFPEATVIDRRDSVLLPGFVDAHVHFPQVDVVGAMGMGLLEWLERRTFPAEARFADAEFARIEAREFLRLLAASGTTSALVFGSHFSEATDVFMAQAQESGLRISSGVTLGDRLVPAPLRTTPAAAREEMQALIDRWHGQGRLRYAVTPRFSLSCSQELLDVCGEVLRDNPGVLFTSHLNETLDEIAGVLRDFPDAGDYLQTYELSGLVGERSVFAHNLHASDSELQRMAASGAVACHCPSSNLFIGSGLFPLRRHLEAGVRLALGSDLGGGTGLGLLREGLDAYKTQMIREDGYRLGAAHLLYLATAAGAQALQLPQVGWFGEGMEFDAQFLRPRPGSLLASRWEGAAGPEDRLAALFTLHGDAEVMDVLVAGRSVLG